MYSTLILCQALCLALGIKRWVRCALCPQGDHHLGSIQCEVHSVLKIWGRSSPLSLEYKYNTGNSTVMVMDRKGEEEGRGVLGRRKALKRCQCIKIAWYVVGKQMFLMIQRGNGWRNSTDMIDVIRVWQFFSVKHRNLDGSHNSFVLIQ